MTLAFLGLAWLLGIAAAAFTTADPIASVAAAGLLGAVSFALRPRAQTLALIAAGCSLVFLAAWRYDSTLPLDAPSGIAANNDSGERIRFQGIVDNEPEERGSSRVYRLDARGVFFNDAWLPTSGKVLVRAPVVPRYEYGDLVEVEGELRSAPLFPDFDYREHLARQGVKSLATFPSMRLLDKHQGNDLSEALIDIRARLAEGLGMALPEPEASLAAGVLLGARRSLPRDLTDAMNTTGTSHLVAVSGQNVSLLAALVIAAFAWVIGRKPATALALCAIIFYAALVGAQPSVIRAAIMGSLYVLAAMFGRQNSAPVALILAATIMTALDPQIAHDVSFQLSAFATLGLMTLAPRLADRFQVALASRPSITEFPLARPLCELIAVSLAAIAFTLPIVAINFQRMSLVAPIANLFAVPAFIIVALTAAIASIGSVLAPPVAGYLGWLAWPFAAYMVAAVRLFAGLPFASIELNGPGAGHALAYYVILATALYFLSKKRQDLPQQHPSPTPHPSSLVPATGLALILTLASLLFWLAATGPLHNRLTVTFLDVGQGDAILIESSSGHRVLIDGGPSPEALAAALGRNLPFYDRRLDLVALTHPESDHLAGLITALERHEVKTILQGPLEADSALYHYWEDLIAESGVVERRAERGLVADLGEARLSILSPNSDTAAADPNSSSLVMKLSAGSVSFLLTGDIGEDTENRLLRSGSDLRAQVLKVAHHGSKTSSSPQFLERVSPLLAVISVGAGNPFGHPASEVLERLPEVTVRTDLYGDVRLSTDGKRLWLETQRQP